MSAVNKNSGVQSRLASLTATQRRLNDFSLLDIQAHAKWKQYANWFVGVLLLLLVFLAILQHYRTLSAAASTLSEYYAQK
jgi:uncharacterized membrane protein